MRGNPPASYPNGWYRLAESKQIKKLQSSSFKLCGRHVAVFRSESEILYGLDAFCTHMGANIGNGGVVKWGRCIECPFHGWTFDGKTGECVNSSSLDTKMTSHHHYHDVNTMEKIENTYLKQEC